MKHNILITGCGGDIGQSIGKILNESKYVNKLYGCDISTKNASKFIFKNFQIGLPCSDENYISNIEKIVLDNNIDFIIPVSEPEIRFLYDNSILNNIGKAILIMASSNAIKIGIDKLKTSNFLKDNNLPFPITNLVTDSSNFKLPVIVKSRSGSGSKDIYKIEDMSNYEFIKKKHPDFIRQEYISDYSGEYTCGLYRSRKGKIRIIILKRELTGGYSGYGEVIENTQIEEVLIEIATLLNLVGSINVQLRISDNKAIVFEINPRFSSTVLFRHMFGFKDLEWSIEDVLGNELGDYIKPKSGSKFYKGFNEYID